MAFLIRNFLVAVICACFGAAAGAQSEVSYRCQHYENVITLQILANNQLNILGEGVLCQLSESPQFSARIGYVALFGSVLSTEGQWRRDSFAQVEVSLLQGYQRGELIWDTLSYDCLRMN